MQIEITERLICQFLNNTPTKLSQNNKSLLLNSFITGTPIISLIDNNYTTLIFIDLIFIQKHNLSIQTLLQPQFLQLADKRLSTITNYIICQLIIGLHIETLPFYFIKLQPDNSIILEYP